MRARAQTFDRRADGAALAGPAASVIPCVRACVRARAVTVLKKQRKKEQTRKRDFFDKSFECGLSQNDKRGDPKLYSIQAMASINI